MGRRIKNVVYKMYLILLLIPILLGGCGDNDLLDEVKNLVAFANVPEINVKFASTDIPLEGTADIGGITVGTYKYVVFTIENEGTADLNLTGIPLVTISGTDASLFTVTSPPTSPIASKGNTTFTVQFTLENIAEKTAIITIPNNDSDEGTYNFTIVGRGPVLVLPKTGQITSYVSGDDGDLQMGVVWPDPRFIDNGDGTISDKLTGLLWTKDGNLMLTRNPNFDQDGDYSEGRVNWQHAMDYIALLNFENYNGYTDWRLPNHRELGSLRNFEQGNPATWLNGKGFINVQATSYWTSTTLANETSQAWLIGLYNNYVSMVYKSDHCFVWAVRGDFDGFIDLPQTGQNLSYAVGDDGDIKKGVAWPAQRFIKNGNGTVSDNLTGLIWEEVPSINLKDWVGAIAYAEEITLGGFNDWRLPNVIELESIINAGEVASFDWLNLQGFNNVAGGYYWTSNTYARTTWFGWIVFMGWGYVYNVNKSNGYYVWAVRGGE